MKRLNKIVSKCIISLNRIPIFICFFFMGCASTSLYQWGNYENFLYKRYIKPGSLQTEEEINALENHLAQTYSKEATPPPGMHAHLGYLYASDGQSSRAFEHFNAEKKLFPESAHFIDGLIERMKK